MKKPAWKVMLFRPFYNSLHTKTEINNNYCYLLKTVLRILQWSHYIFLEIFADEAILKIIAIE